MEHEAYPLELLVREATSGLDPRTLELVYSDGAFSRLDESDDAGFYAVDRFVDHLDSAARAEVTRIIEALVCEEQPEVLDLMASADSHLPAGLAARRVVGLGLNPRELAANPRLDERVVHDLNRDPRLPFPAESFDIVLSTVAVDYLTRPFEVFAEVARVLRPGGLHLVVFSNRMFPEKAVRLWREASEQERVYVVEDYFVASGQYGASELFVVQGRPRPADDRHAAAGRPSDPVYAVWAEKRGAPLDRQPALRTAPTPPPAPWDPEEIAERSACVESTRCCPYCEERLSRFKVPESPFFDLGSEYYWICFNDECAYLLAGFDAMSAQGNLGYSLRFMYDPDSRRCGSVPVPSLAALKDSIVD